jgi:LDH2 family malate/lactate/ureidoglycolate dehydrogenase
VDEPTTLLPATSFGEWRAPGDERDGQSWRSGGTLRMPNERGRPTTGGCELTGAINARGIEQMADRTGNDRIHLTVGDARALGEAAMRGAAFDDEDARILTDHVLDAALCGYEYSGLPKLLNVVDDPNFRQKRHPVAVVRETGATALLDGGNTTGMIAAYHASEAVINRAQAHGIAVVCLGNTWMTGRSADYCEMIARAGLVVLHTVASPPAVAPFGGMRPALGTNPIAFGFPTDSDPLVIDMGTSAFMATDLQFRARLGTPIPQGVALGPDGHPTTDAVIAQQGALLPFGGSEGGYKGFGLALAMDAFGALTAGIRPADSVSGYLFFAFKPDLFLSPEGYRQEVGRRIAAIKASPRHTGIAEIRVPGERSYATRSRLVREGIEIDRKIHAALGRLADGNLDHGG